MEDHQYLEARRHLKKYKIHTLDIPGNDQVHISRALHEAYKNGRNNSNKQSKIYNYSCKCGWLHLQVWDGFKCAECGRIFDAKKSIN